MKKVAERLFEGEGDETQLLAGRNKADGRLKFPFPLGRESENYDLVPLSRKGKLWSWTVQRFPLGRESENYDLVPLSRKGKLWSWTVQRFRPKPPYDGRGDEGDFTPYAVGYIELPDQLIVEGRIIVSDFDTLRIGQPMRVVTEDYRDENGEPVLTYAFLPDSQESIL